MFNLWLSGKGRCTPTYSDVAEYVDEEGVEPDHHESEEEDVDGGRARGLLPQADLGHSHNTYFISVKCKN